MKKIIFLLITCSTFILWTCKDDDDNHEMNEPHNHEEVVGFENYEVDFFKTHQDLIIKPATYETVTEQVLIRPAHQEGAFFETATEQYLVKESSNRFQIMDSTIIYIVADAERDSIAKIACYHFFDKAEIEEIQIPAEYQTRTVFNQVQAGTGAEVLGTYSTITRRILLTAADTLPNMETQLFKKVTFRIPADQTIQGYLSDQFSQQSIVECEEGNAYRIVE